MIKSGDVFGIQTAKGEAYFQYVNKNALMGQLIRVLPGTYKERVPELGELVESTSNFWIFFPLGTCLRRKIVRKVGHFNVPQHAQETPTFRSGVVDPATGKVETWWLWDGEKSWRVGKISDEQRKLPIRGAWNDTLLIQRIEEGWLPERDKR